MADIKNALKDLCLDDLPLLAQELIALIGIGATMQLINHRPGLPIYIPVVASEAHDLAKILGMHVFAQLVKNYGGDTLTPPNCKIAFARVRHRNVLKLRNSGYSQTEVAGLTGLTPRQIRNIESAMPKEDLNLRLF